MALGPIQRTAIGLASLLRLQMRGAMPSLLSEEVRPVLDLEGWYMRSQMRQWASLPTRSIGSFSNTFISWIAAADVIQVPNDQWWYISHCTIKVLCPAGDRLLGAAVAFEAPPSVPTGRVCVVGRPQSVETVGLGAIGVALEAHDFWMPPGSFLGWYTGYNANLTEFTLGDLRYVPLDLHTG